MPSDSCPHCEIHLVGSIPLRDAHDVFTTIGRRLGPRITRLPDGETGERTKWLGWLTQVFQRDPLLEPVRYEGDPRNATAAPDRQHFYHFKPKAALHQLDFSDVGYARYAIASYAEFSKVKAAGLIPGNVRFLVCIPSPFNIISRNFVPEIRLDIEPFYEQGLRQEVARIVAAIPHDQLAIQWDVSRDMLACEGAVETYFDDVPDGVSARLARVGSLIPSGVELGFHLCYGSFGGQHLVEPRDTGLMVDLFNRVSDKVRRTIEWVHMPVPVERHDEGYFAPLAGLRKRPETRIFLGLVHDSDGTQGTLRRMRAASRSITQYGIATECGWGRRDPASVDKLIGIHAEVADLADSRQA